MIKNNPEKRREDILKVLFGFNLIALIISIFYSSKTSTLTIIILNLILLGSFFVLGKYGSVFDGLIATNKFSKNLNKKLGGL